MGALCWILVSAQLGQRRGILVRRTGEIVMLDGEDKAYKIPSVPGGEY
jgi:hypothetical protein